MHSFIAELFTQMSAALSTSAPWRICCLIAARFEWDHLVILRHKFQEYYFQLIPCLVQFQGAEWILSNAKFSWVLRTLTQRCVPAHHGAIHNISGSIF